MTSTMVVDVTAEGYRVVIVVDAYDWDELLSRREWTERLPAQIL